MGRRMALDGRASGLMLLLCAIWGFQQITIKAAAPDMAPTLQIALRSGVAALLVGLYLVIKGRGLLPGRHALPAGILAGIFFALEFLFIGEGLRYTNASHMVVMLYTAPAFAALGLHFRVPEERMIPVQWLGLLLAFGGIITAFYSPTASEDQSWHSVVIGDFFGLLAGMAWGASTVVIRGSCLAEIPAAQSVFIQLLLCFIILLIAVSCSGQWSFAMSDIVWASLTFQALVVSFASFLTWIWLLGQYLATHLGVVSFLTPVFGMIFGVTLLNEKLEASFVIGTFLILTGVILVSVWRSLRGYWSALSARFQRR